MHKDVKRALEEAVKSAAPPAGYLSKTAQQIVEQKIVTAIQVFLRNLPNHSDMVNGTGCWYPARILAELTGEE